MTTWKELIELAAKGEHIIYCTLTDEEMMKPFDAGFGLIEGKPFTAWGGTHVFFPAVYDGCEWVARVPRNPCDKPTAHVGGE